MTRAGVLQAALELTRCTSLSTARRLCRLGCMNDGNELHLIGPDEIAYRLDLTPAQLKITWTALKSLLDDFGHDERDMHELVARCSTSCQTSTRLGRSTSAGAGADQAGPSEASGSPDGDSDGFSNQYS